VIPDPCGHSILNAAEIKRWFPAVKSALRSRLFPQIERLETENQAESPLLMDKSENVRMMVNNEN